MADDRFAEDKLVRDPIHGFIRYNRLERDIINSPQFQRLRHIRQLGPTFLAYPGAEHTRFHHSLGVMHVATRILDLILLRWKARLRWTVDDIARNRQLLRIACLLHDVGHGPLSHTSERLFPGNRTHVDYSSLLVRSEPLRSLVNDDCSRRYEFNADDVANLIERRPLDPRAAFLNEILSGDLDADRMDYLLRDSLYCGVAYGSYDLERLLHTLTLRRHRSGNWVLAIDDGGVPAAEGLILARYFMFAQVYFHAVARIYEYHICEFLADQALDGGRLPSGLREYLSWDDVKVFGALKEAGGRGSQAAKRILQRQHFREVARTSNHLDDTENVIWLTMLSDIRRRFPSMKFREDTSGNSSHAFATADFHVVVSPQETMHILDRSEVAARLPSIFKKRLYVEKGMAQEVESICDGHFARLRPRGKQEELE